MSTIDPTIDKNFEHWEVEADPPPDVAAVCFKNADLGYFSYNPPRGFTAEEIMQFRGAETCLTLEKTKELIQARDELGTLDLTGDARWK
ncbi:hypothetical protein C8J56DRAFT_1043073 [Mycena floridula]|nr:hypothetical protein C8J56DRAFT_1043073 [Mycena floridula]